MVIDFLIVQIASVTALDSTKGLSEDKGCLVRNVIQLLLFAGVYVAHSFLRQPNDVAR
jgi:hypothetical protein